MGKLREKGDDLRATDAPQPPDAEWSADSRYVGAFGKVDAGRAAAAADLNGFLALYPPTDPRWEGIDQSLRDTNYPTTSPTDLIEIIRTHYGL